MKASRVERLLPLLFVLLGLGPCCGHLHLLDLGVEKRLGYIRQGCTKYSVCWYSPQGRIG
jgi:hypothetical protein